MKRGLKKSDQERERNKIRKKKVGKSIEREAYLTWKEDRKKVIKREKEKKTARKKSGIVIGRTYLTNKEDRKREIKRDKPKILERGVLRGRHS